MRMNEKEWIRNRYNAWVSSFYHLHSSSSASPSSSSFFICHLPLSRRSPAALQPLFQTPLFCFEKRARLDSNRGSTVRKLRVLVQCAHQHQNSRHERPAVPSSPQTLTTPIFFFLPHRNSFQGCKRCPSMNLLIHFHCCIPVDVVSTFSQ